MNIRPGTVSEIENFPLYDEANEGSEIIVVEKDGNVVGYAQFNEGYDDAEIFFMEAVQPGNGIGKAMIEWFKSQYIEITAVNAIETARPFYARMGFEENGGTGWAGQVNMTWWSE